MVELDPNGCRFDWVHLGRTESMVELVRESVLSGTLVCVRARNPSIWIHSSLLSVYGGVQPKCVQMDEGTSRETLPDV
jgi:hypothetical protein